MAATLVTSIGLPRSGMYKNILGALEILGRRLNQGASNVMSGAASLFFNNEQGVWYDPSDFSTMFQDSAGTTPVTAVEQPVGLVLDKSKGLVLGPELVTNGDFSSAGGWSVGATWSISGGTLNSLSATADNISQAGILVVGKTYYVSYTVTAQSAGTCQILIGNATAGLPASAVGTYSGYFVCSGNTTLYINKNATFVGTIDNISVRELPGNHATQATAASRPILKQDANGKYYLFFDGVDDSLATAAIDFTSTDKMTVFAGVRKLSDAAAGVVAELSADDTANNGSFFLSAPYSAAANIGFRGHGTLVSSTAALSPASYPAPTTRVLTGISNISAPSNILRINGAVVTTNTVNQGTGNYGNHPLYIGRRGGASLPFNGHLYSLIIRGAQSSDSQIASAESYVNSKTGAY